MGNNVVGKKVEDVNKKVDNAKQGVTTTYEANVAGIKKTQNDIKQKGKLFGNKFKKKAMGMQMKLSKKNVDEDVELVVDQNDVNYFFFLFVLSQFLLYILVHGV